MSEPLRAVSPVSPGLDRASSRLWSAHPAILRAPLIPRPTVRAGAMITLAQCRSCLRPGSTEDVARIVKLCAETGTAIVPQGGNTGLTGASQPHPDMSEVIISTSRLNKIRDLDLDNDTMTVEAGVILQQIQQLAADNNRLFPLSLGAEGSCQIGGNLSTNAGGTQVLRYGNTRSLVLGLEVVMPNGEVWNGLRGLRKDNTGYDMKHLFIGGEGTLGIITAAVSCVCIRNQAQWRRLGSASNHHRTQSRCSSHMKSQSRRAGVCVRIAATLDH